MDELNRRLTNFPGAGFRPDALPGHKFSSGRSAPRGERGVFAGDSFAPALPCSSIFRFANSSPALPRPALNPAGCSCVMENPAWTLASPLGVFPPRRQDSQLPGLHGDPLSLTFFFFLCQGKVLTQNFDILCQNSWRRH